MAKQMGKQNILSREWWKNVLSMKATSLGMGFPHSTCFDSFICTKLSFKKGKKHYMGQDISKCHLSLEPNIKTVHSRIQEQQPFYPRYMAMVTKGPSGVSKVAFFKIAQSYPQKNVYKCSFSVVLLSKLNLDQVGLHFLVPLCFPANLSQLESSAGICLQKKYSDRNKNLLLQCVQSSITQCHYDIQLF